MKTAETPDHCRNAATRGDWTRLTGVVAFYTLATAAWPRLSSRGFDSSWFVFAAMISVLGFAFVLHPVLALRVPGFLRQVRPWEARGHVYRWLGVSAFGYLLRHTPLRRLNTRVYLHGASRRAAPVLALMESAEASHLASAALVLPYMAWAGWHGEWATVAWFSLAQAIVNAYPVFHLRMARGRLGRALGRSPRC